MHRGIAIVILSLLFLSCTSKAQDRVVVEDVKEEVAELILADIEPLKSYPKLKQGAIDKRDSFRKAYTACGKNKQKQDSILAEAQSYLTSVANDFFRSWYGTPWDFNGHSKVPRQGHIACGYFVTTTLQDMGFNIPRIKWAQQGSEYVVKKLSGNIVRSSNKPMKSIVDDIKQRGEGLYIVGLDSHVGYIYYHKTRMSFVHANYYYPETGVMSEPMIGRNPLSHSKYRVIGKILETEMVLNWILGTAYAV